MEGYKKRGEGISTTLKMRAFALEYFKTLDERASAIKVGYKAHSAGIKGKELLKDERVVKTLAALTRRAVKKEIATVEWRKETLQRIADTNADKASASLSIAAIAELNKMSGDYAPTRTESKNLNIESDLTKVRELLAEHKKDY